MDEMFNELYNDIRFEFSGKNLVIPVLQPFEVDQGPINHAADPRVEGACHRFVTWSMS